MLTISTKQISRQLLIGLQIKYIFDKIMPKKPISRIINNGILNHRWVRKLEIQAYTDKERLTARLAIMIDWEVFMFYKKRVGSRVAVPSDHKKKDYPIWNVENAVSLFRSVLKKSSLQTRMLVYTEEDLSDGKAHRRLGISKTKDFEWEKGNRKIILQESPKNLSEVTLLMEALD